MKSHIAVLLSIGVILLAGTDHFSASAPIAAQRATDDAGHVTYGAGLFTCGRWVSDQRDATMHSLETQWVLGWISSADYSWAVMRRLKADFPELNKFPFPALALTDGDAIEAWMNKYCADHPLDTVLDGTKTLVLELQQRGGRQ